MRTPGDIETELSVLRVELLMSNSHRLQAAMHSVLSPAPAHTVEAGDVAAVRLPPSAPVQELPATVTRVLGADREGRIVADLVVEFAVGDRFALRHAPLARHEPDGPFVFDFS